MGVRDFYTNKNILITGVTEFLGKVILERIIRSIPEIGTIYVLIRNKEGSSFAERFKREVVSSPCFDELRKTGKKFEEFLDKKVVPIAGVIIKEGLGLTEDVLNTLIENVHIVIHCAATADFNARLDDALKINVRGPLDVLSLAKRMKNLENFIFVSTCYVNSDKRGTIEEKIYDKDQDPDVIVKEIEQIPASQVIARTSAFLGSFPNTLTFTFSLCEKLLAKHRENVPLTIVRLSIPGATYSTPFPGWVEKVSTAGALYLLGGIGLIKVAKGDPTIIGDQIPIDFCSDTIIVAGARYARNNDVTVIHCSTSAANPVTWGYCTDVVASYWKLYPPQKKVGDCNFRLQKNSTLLEAEQFARRAPILLFHKFAYKINSPPLKRSATKSYNALLRSEQVSEQFQHFTMNEWVFISQHTEELKAFCTEEERSMFQLDVSTIEWKRYLLNYAWGLHRFILKEEVDPPTDADRQNVLLTAGRGIYNNLTWVLSRGSDFRPMPKAKVRALVLQSEKVTEAIKGIIATKKPAKLSDKQFEEQLYKIAHQETEFIFSDFNQNHTRMLGFLINIVSKQIYDKIVVDEVVIQNLKNFDFKTHGPLIFMPTHRSYMDFVLISYILFTFSLRLPQVVSAEDFLNMALFPILMRGAGAFFIRRKKSEYPEIYNAILYEYIQRLIITQNWLEFFVEGTRSRYGKTLAPKFGIITMIMDALLENKIPDAQIVPITLNYERIVEGESFPFELLGEPKVKESLTRLLKAVNVIAMNFGKIYVEVAKPFSLQQFVDSHSTADNGKKLDVKGNKADRFTVIKKLGYEVVYQLNENLVVMSTAMVSSLLLMHRKGISEELLGTKVEWLADQLRLRKVKIGAIEGKYSGLSVEYTIELLSKQVEKKKDIYHIKIPFKQDYKNILMLACYRNTLIHAFWLESIIACSLSSFGQDLAWKEGIPLDRLWNEVSFVDMLVKKEFQLREKLTRESLPTILERMVGRGILEIKFGEETKVKVAKGADEIMSFLCHLIWPFLESYWVTSVYLFSMRNRTSPILMRKFTQEIQWFAESMYEERIIEFYEACGLDTIKNAVSIFKEMKMITVFKQEIQKTMVTEEIVEAAMPEEKLKAIEDHIKKFLKDSFAKSVNSPIELARKSVLLDYPFMAKM